MWMTWAGSVSVSEAFQSAVNEVESIDRSYTADLTYAEPKPSLPSTVKKLFQQEVFFAVGSDNASTSPAPMPSSMSWRKDRSKAARRPKTRRLAAW
jgi:hypothetical protein